eukprot:5555186-Amphidinium_carterae.1
MVRVGQYGQSLVTVSNTVSDSRRGGEAPTVRALLALHGLPLQQKSDAELDALGGLRDTYRAVSKLPVLVTAGRGMRREILRVVCRSQIGRTRCGKFVQAGYRLDLLEAWMRASAEPDVHVLQWLRLGAPTGRLEAIDCAGLFPLSEELTSSVKKSAEFYAKQVLNDFDHEGHKNYKSFEEAG